MNPQSTWQFLDVTPDNVEQHGIFCIRKKNSDGFRAKLKWFLEQYELGFRLFIAANSAGKQLGFIECIPAEFSWRPLQAEGYLFVQCITVYSKSDRQQGLGTALVERCEEVAKEEGMAGVCTMTSKGSWMADKGLFERSEFTCCDKRDRFELMYKPFKEDATVPELLDWTEQLKNYQGWHLVYADQCPWHGKSVDALVNAAAGKGIELQVTKLATPEQARNAPSGFGTFSLVCDGQLLADHYISKTRFLNILKKGRV